MEHIIGKDRFPAFTSTLEERIKSDNPARFINAFMELLLLEQMAFRLTSAATGRSSTTTAITTVSAPPVNWPQNACATSSCTGSLRDTARNAVCLEIVGRKDKALGLPLPQEGRETKVPPRSLTASYQQVSKAATNMSRKF